ncbi:DNA-directed RNA polymerase delta subunit [Bradyrhizobium diazoefficiens]
MRHTGGTVPAPEDKPANGSLDHPGALLGLSIVDAAKALLASKRTPLKNPDFAAMFKVGGLHMNSKEPAYTIGSVLTRRMNEVGDVVRVGRGTWGLREWYPNRSFKSKGEDKKEGKPSQGGSETDPDFMN